MDTTHFKKFWTLLKDVKENTRPYEYKVDNWEESLDSKLIERPSINTT